MLREVVRKLEYFFYSASKDGRLTKDSTSMTEKK